MVVDILLLEEGTSDGVIVVFDMKGVLLGHLLRMGLFTTKHFMNYLQEGMPVRIRGLQFFNIVSFIDKILLLVKPFMKKSMFDMLQLHSSVEPVFQHVPAKMFPNDYPDGTAPSIDELHGMLIKSYCELVSSNFLFICLVKNSSPQNY